MGKKYDMLYHSKVCYSLSICLGIIARSGAFISVPAIGYVIFYVAHFIIYLFILG